MTAVPRVVPPPDFTPFDRAVLAGSIPRRFAEQVRRGPGRVALRTLDRTVSYGALAAHAGAIARAILDARGPGEEAIAVLLGNEPLVVAAVLGVWKAGKICVPLDPVFPAPRVAYALADSGAALLVTSRDTLGGDAPTGGPPVLLADEVPPSDADADIDLSGAGTTLAGITYTSGTSGQPKGVMQSHEHLLHTNMVITNALAISPSDGLAQFASPGGAYMWWIMCNALLNGATLCQFDIRRHGLAELAAWLRRGDITLVHSLELMRRLAPTLAPGERFDRVRIVTMGGDAVYASDVENYRRHFGPRCVLAVGFGSTEGGRIAWNFIDHDAAIDAGPVSLGDVVPDKRLLLLGEDGRDAGEADAVGEIAIQSRFLAPGYWRRPDLTTATFRPDPAGGAERIYLTGDMGRRGADGRVVHLGRKDAQVKIRGFSVSLTEVESALRRVPGVRAAAVVDREDRPGQRRLVAYVVASGSPPPTVSEIRRALSATLADHMIPTAFVAMDAIPRNALDKVDRAALPAPDTARPALDVPMLPPRTPTESALAHIWADVLGVDEVGVVDSFFELGGNSLLVAAMLARVRERLGVELDPRAVFESPTVAELAARVLEHRLSALDATALGRALDALPGDGG